MRADVIALPEERLERFLLVGRRGLFAARPDDAVADQVKGRDRAERDREHDPAAFLDLLPERLSIARRRRARARRPPGQSRAWRGGEAHR